MISKLLALVVVLLPWPMKRFVLQRWRGYRLDKTARIGLAWVYPRHLVMESNSRIDHFTVAIHLDEIVLGPHASIGRRNWITGFPSGTDSPHFGHQPDRISSLHVGEHSAITKNHHIDCTSPVTIGRFSTIAGYDSQLLTHSVDLEKCRQSSSPIVIGDYTFIGTKVVILGGSTLPARSVLAASSLLNRPYSEECTIYAGIPARPVKAICDEMKYFKRSQGFVH